MLNCVDDIVVIFVSDKRMSRFVPSPRNVWDSNARGQNRHECLAKRTLGEGEDDHGRRNDACVLDDEEEETARRTSSLLIFYSFTVKRAEGGEQEGGGQREKVRRFSVFFSNVCGMLRI